MLALSRAACGSGAAQTRAFDLRCAPGVLIISNGTKNRLLQLRTKNIRRRRAA